MPLIQPGFLNGRNKKNKNKKRRRNQSPNKRHKKNNDPSHDNLKANKDKTNKENNSNSAKQNQAINTNNSRVPQKESRSNDSNIFGTQNNSNSNRQHFRTIPKSGWTSFLKDMVVKCAMTSSLDMNKCKIAAFVDLSNEDILYYVVYDDQSKSGGFGGCLCLVGSYKDYIIDSVPKMTLKAGSMMSLELFGKQAYEGCLRKNNIKMPWRGETVETGLGTDSDEKQAGGDKGKDGGVYISSYKPKYKPHKDISNCLFMHMLPQMVTNNIKMMMIRIVAQNGFDHETVQICAFAEPMKMDLHYYVVWDKDSQDDDKGALCLIGTHMKGYTIDLGDGKYFELDPQQEICIDKMAKIEYEAMLKRNDIPMPWRNFILNE